MFIFSDLEEIVILTEVTLQTLEGLIDKGVINAHLSSTCMHFQPLHICYECCTFTLTRVRLLNTLYGSKSGHLSQGSTLPCRLSHRWLDEAQLS